MICDIYRSDTKTGLYIYLEKDKEIADLPDELIKLIGKHNKVMELDLSTRDKLANEDIYKVKTNILELGYHVQVPKDLVKSVLNFRV
jgi:uncharacterized protein YcgL (UPF0745 family)